jgi:hypothetical protein
MSDGAPFKVGQRVRMSESGRKIWPGRKSFVGVVKSVGKPYAEFRLLGWYVKVSRDGVKGARHWEPVSSWKAVPLDDLTLDETCQQLVAAYHAGEKSAALGLAERVFELLGGTKRENP